MRLIDADKLMENKFKNDISYNAFCNLVKRQPSIDAVPVIMCKDCKHCIEDKGDLVSVNVCELNHNKVQPDDWFCADGEREKDG